MQYLCFYPLSPPPCLISRPCPRCVPDCGAGIGRVAASLLLHHFQEVDLVEPYGKHIFMRSNSIHFFSCYASAPTTFVSPTHAPSQPTC